MWEVDRGGQDWDEGVGLTGVGWLGGGGGGGGLTGAGRIGRRWWEVDRGGLVGKV